MKKLFLTIVAFIIVINALSQPDSSDDNKFSGPINAATTNTKVAWIYPTIDMDAASLKMLQNYVSEMFNTFKTEGSILIPDSIALSAPMSDYGLMVYGTIESNLFLKHYKSLYPFKIENNTIYADKEYKDERTKFITCLPNPQNPQKGMVIYTGLSNKNIVGINGVFHGPTDFIASINLNMDNLSLGNYDKTESKWKFKKE